MNTNNIKVTNWDVRIVIPITYDMDYSFISYAICKVN